MSHPITHPSWCALPPLCTAEQAGGTHRSAPADFYALAAHITFTLFALPADRTFLTVAMYDPMGGSGDGFAFTLDLPDAWRLADLLTATLERAR